MRSIPLTLLTFVILLAITSCKKPICEDTKAKSEYNTRETQLTSDEIYNLIHEYQHIVTANTSRDEDPINPANVYDTYGQYFAAMMDYLILNYNVEAMTLTQYNQVIQDYISNHPIPEFEIVDELNQIDFELIQLAKNIVSNPEVDVAVRIQQLKNLETLISEATIFTADTKKLVLTSISLDKHLLSVIRDTEGDVAGLPFCIEEYADDCMDQKLDVIFNTQNEDYNLVASIAYCATLPENVMIDYASCLWEGYQNC